MTAPLNIIFDDCGLGLLGYDDKVWLSIYPTRALFHKYILAIKYR